MELSEAIIKALGSDYKEEMTAEEVITALGGKKIVDLSKGGYVSEDKYTNAVNDKKKAEKDYNALKMSQMSEEEKRDEALREKDNRIAEVEKELRKTQSEKVFAASGLAEEDYASIVDFVTPEQAVSFVAIINKAKEAAKQEAKEPAMRDFKSPQGGSTPPKKKWSEMTLDERAELHEKDPTEYENLRKQNT